ncbi:hypothetical protein HPH06_00705 [Bifidobacterium breve]|nr:hypothetical protein [Bifidobacterium breve]MDB1190318.1 hypothetical protein [Bifidobacterium breve]UVT06099.1 hypothetical protein HPH06_00705 [Bifidobacterium breve]
MTQRKTMAQRKTRQPKQARRNLHQERSNCWKYSDNDKRRQKAQASRHQQTHGQTGSGTFYTRSLILIKLFDSSIDKHSGRIPLQPSRFQRLADHAQYDVTSTAIRIAMLP